MRDEEQWTYFLGIHPVFAHQTSDLRMFRLATGQLIESGACKQADVIRVFGVSKRSVSRWQAKFRAEGSQTFFKTKRGRRGGTVLSPPVLDKAQRLLDQAHSRNDVADELGVLRDTLRKAINDGRLSESKQSGSSSTKSSRTVVDAQAAESLGTACTRVEERVYAAFGVCDGAPVRFESCLDVPKGGVLCALPALLMTGLLEGTDKLLKKVEGYYTTFHILLLLAFMFLCRIKTVEKLRGHSPGEFGKLMGLDRIPEVRCLRNKIKELSIDGGAKEWAVHLGKHWMKSDPEAVGTLYIDGHVRVYNGSLTKPPRRYVSRERLCLRGTTDYWVNDSIGRPFFLVEKPIDTGLVNTLRDDIVPRLLEDIPNQPSKQELERNPYCCRFVLVFDREGYSPAFFGEMWREHRIGCMTYHKFPAAAWPEEWFSEIKATMPNGETVNMQLAEMGSFVGSGKDALWMREVRKLTESGHQTSLVSTFYDASHIQLAVSMFSRWCQENFFRYMSIHFAIDLLQEYGAEDFPDTQMVVNPLWRKLNRERNSVQNKLRHRRANFAALTLHAEDEKNKKRYDRWVNKKATLLEQIQQYEHQLEELKGNLKKTDNHIPWGELEEKDKFQRLLPSQKQFTDTIRMIAYRAETAMVGLLVGPTVDASAARRLLQDLFLTEADVLPDPAEKILRVRIHAAARPAANHSLSQLFSHLNNAKIVYPGTDMQIVYESIISSGQE